MNTFKLLKNHIQKQNKKDLIKKLNYNSNKRGLITLNSLLNSNSFKEWIKNFKYDFKYGQKDFLLELINLLNISKKDKEDIFFEFKKSKLEIFQPKIIIHTDFNRTYESITSLIYVSNILLKIKLDKSYLLNQKNKDKYIHRICFEHFQENNKKINILGKEYNIIKYEYIDIYNNSHYLTFF